MNRPHPSSKKAPDSGDHRGWAEHWADEALAALRHVLEDSPDDPGYRLNELHLERSCRLAWWHAARAKNYRYWDPEGPIDRQRPGQGRFQTRPNRPPKEDSDPGR